MKKFTYLKSTLATLALAFLGACSSSQYTFAPKTGSYHETVAKKTAEKPEIVAYASAAEKPVVEATPVVNEQTEASAALVQAITIQKVASPKNNSSAAAVNTDVKADKKAARETKQQLRKDIKVLKKKIKENKASGVNGTVKLLIILGLVFIILGLILPFLAVVGLVLLLIGLVLLLMDLL